MRSPNVNVFQAASVHSFRALLVFLVTERLFQKGSQSAVRRFVSEEIRTLNPSFNILFFARLCVEPKMDENRTVFCCNARGQCRATARLWMIFLLVLMYAAAAS